MLLVILGGVRTWAERCVAALEAIVAAIVAASRLPSLERHEAEVAALRLRVEELERSRVQFEAESTGLLRRAEGERRTARAAEDRTKRAEARIEALEGAEGGEPGTMEELAAAYAAQGHPAGVPNLPPVVGNGRPNRRAAALAAKWGS